MALTQTLIPLSEQQKWEEALNGLTHTFAHTHAYTSALAGASADRTFLYVAEGERFKAACPFTERVSHDVIDIVSPYGFSGLAYRGSCKFFAEAFRDFMGQQGYVAGYLVQQLLADCQELADNADLFVGKQCFLMDLRLPDDKLLEGMASDHRSRLRQWWRQAPQLITDKTCLVDSFVTLYPEAMKRVQAKESYFFPSATLRQLIASPHALLIGAEKGGAIEAVSLFLYKEGYAEYYLNACTENGRRHARRLLWHAAQMLRTLGVDTLNLGCGIAEGDALEVFKHRFGGHGKRFTVLKQVYRPGAYAALCRAQCVNEQDRSGFFPAYRAAKTGLRELVATR